MPVTSCNAVSPHPDLTDLALSPRLTGVRIDDGDSPSTRARPQPTSERMPLTVPDFDDAISFRAPRHRLDRERRSPRDRRTPSGSLRRGHRRETSLPAGIRMGRTCRANSSMVWRRTGSAPFKRDLPAVEVQRGALGGCGAPHTQVVTEIRAVGVGAAIARDGVQPADWLLHERRRRHHDVEMSVIERLQNAADEAEVVSVGQPVDADAVVVMPETFGYAAQVGDDIGVGNDDAFAIRSRARRVLQVGDSIAGDRGAPGARQLLRRVFGGQTYQRFSAGICIRVRRAIVAAVVRRIRALSPRRCPGTVLSSP